MRANRPLWPVYILIVAMLALAVSGCTAADDDLVAPVTADSIAPAPPVEPQGDVPDFDLEGHRGARGLKPENTLPAFEAALDLGVTTLEFDLHFTADEVVVVWHDDFITPDKCYLDTNDANPPPDPDDPAVNQDDLRISRLFLSQLKQYRCDHNPEPSRFPEQENSGTDLAGDDYHIPTLAEIFDFVDEYAVAEGKRKAQRTAANKVQFNIETKRKVDDPDAIGDDFDGVNPGAFEIAIVELVETRGLIERTILQSFDHRSLWAARTLNEDLRLAALTSRIIPGLSGYAANGAVIWSPNYGDVTATRLQDAHDLGLLVIPWTVNDLDEGQRLIEMDVDGLITDRPDRFLADQ